jgi:type I restriction enzyme M protein
MLSPHIRKKVTALWDTLWSAGLSPFVVIEQITYLLLLKRLEEFDDRRIFSGKKSIYEMRLSDDPLDFDGRSCSWKYLCKAEITPRHLRETVFPWLRTLGRRLSEHRRNKEQIGFDAFFWTDVYFQLDSEKSKPLRSVIKLIDELFPREKENEANADNAGDIFEYLLSQVSIIGKNGQFITPRHITRFMVELLNPQPGDRIIDPANGTGGFLVSAHEHMRRAVSGDSQRRLWDGTPLRLERTKQTLLREGDNFVGVDLDRSMVQISWMNLALHGVDNPALMQGNSLSGNDFSSQKMIIQLASERYRFVLANAPFTGAVDSNEMASAGYLPVTSPSARQQTKKTELLFLWRTLDLLEVGGRAAVIVPEGVLFGNSGAHLRLRREWLIKHTVEAVISLPAGTFKPYSGVKTAILVLRKDTSSKSEPDPTDYPLHAKSVWFYEVEADGFSLDDLRSSLPGEDNDLWDALAHFQRLQQSTTHWEEGQRQYFQPTYYRERWRNTTPGIDGPPTARAVLHGKPHAIHEIHRDLPSDPHEAETYIAQRVRKSLEQLAAECDVSDRRWKNAVKSMNRFFKIDGPASKLWHEWVEAAEQNVSLNPASNISVPLRKLDQLARQVAKIDGYDIYLRTAEVSSRKASAPKQWRIPIRSWRRDPAWHSVDGKLVGSHDEHDQVRPQYVTVMEPHLYVNDQLQDHLLDTDCLEARNWRLVINQYKPFELPDTTAPAPILELIDELRDLEQSIAERLDRLRTLVGTGA